MPALTMRGRYLMREYWEDSALHRKLNADEREFYQGLWMLADDEGWLPRDVPGIAAALYRFENPHERETTVTERLAKLRDLGKVVSHRCCIEVPTVRTYPRPGNKTRVHFEHHQTQHQTGSAKTKRVQTGSIPTLPVPSSPVPTQPSAGARPPVGGAARDFDQLMADNGFPRPSKVPA